MQAFLDSILKTVGEHVPSLVAALAVLIVGWIVSLIVAALAKAALKRTTIDDKIAAWIRGDDASKKVEVEGWVSRVVFYLCMVFVLVAFFQALGLTIITEPLNELLREVFRYAPRILATVLLVVLAWIVATALRFVVSRTLRAAKFEERVGDEVGLEKDKPIPVSKTLSESVYWLVYLLFLPAILHALALDGLLQPVQGMINKILAYLPNLFGAGLILALGWFAAKIVQRVLTSLLAAAGTDRLAENVGLAQVLGEKKKLSWVLGFTVYVLMLIPVLVASLNALGLEAITQPASQMLNQILAALPHIFAATLVLGLAYVVGKVVAALVTNLLAGIGFNRVLVGIGLAKEEVPAGKKTPAEIAGYFVLIGVLVFAGMEAAHLLGFDSLRAQMERFVVFAGDVVLGIVILGLGLFLANLAATTIQSGRSEQAKVLALAARVSIVVLSGAMALSRMGLAPDIINLAFGALVIAVAVAFAISFGWGGRDLARQQLESWATELKARKEGAA